MRSKLLDTARSIGLAAEQVDAPFEQLLAAEEAFISNSLIGLWPLKRVEGVELPGAGPVIRRLRMSLEHPMLAETGAEMPQANPLQRPLM